MRSTFSPSLSIATVIGSQAKARLGVRRALIAHRADQTAIRVIAARAIDSGIVNTLYTNECE